MLHVSGADVNFTLRVTDSDSLDVLIIKKRIHFLNNLHQKHHDHLILHNLYYILWQTNVLT